AGLGHVGVLDCAPDASEGAGTSTGVLLAVKARRIRLTTENVPREESRHRKCLAERGNSPQRPAGLLGHTTRCSLGGRVLPTLSVRGQGLRPSGPIGRGIVFRWRGFPVRIRGRALNCHCQPYTKPTSDVGALLEVTGCLVPFSSPRTSSRHRRTSQARYGRNTGTAASGSLSALSAGPSSIGCLGTSGTPRIPLSRSYRLLSRPGSLSGGTPSMNAGSTPSVTVFSGGSRAGVRTR